MGPSSPSHTVLRYFGDNVWEGVHHRFQVGKWNHHSWIWWWQGWKKDWSRRWGPHSQEGGAILEHCSPCLPCGPLVSTVQMGGKWGLEGLRNDNSNKNPLSLVVHRPDGEVIYMVVWWEKSTESRDQWGCSAGLEDSSVVGGEGLGRVRDTHSFWLAHWVNGGAICWDGKCCQAEDVMFGWIGGTCGTSWGKRREAAVQLHVLVWWSKERSAVATGSGRSGVLNAHVCGSLADGTPWVQVQWELQGGDPGEPERAATTQQETITAVQREGRQHAQECGIWSRLPGFKSWLPCKLPYFSMH